MSGGRSPRAERRVLDHIKDRVSEGAEIRAHAIACELGMSAVHVRVCLHSLCLQGKIVLFKSRHYCWRKDRERFQQPAIQQPVRIRAVPAVRVCGGISMAQLMAGR